jgi:hypothetical protein
MLLADHQQILPRGLQLSPATKEPSLHSPEFEEPRPSGNRLILLMALNAPVRQFRSADT